MRPSALLTALLARLESRHWVALGASAALHLAVYLAMDVEPPPEPKPVSFEIALEPPKPESPARAKGKTQSADAKTKKAHAKRKPAKREPHVLEAKWRGESKPAPDAPRLDLPDARALGVQAPVEEIVKPGAATRPSLARTEPAPQAAQTETPPPSQAISQGAEATQLSDPGSGGVSAAAGNSGEPGITLAASTSLSRGGINPGSLSRGGQGSDPHAGLAASGSSGQAGPGGGSLSTSQGNGTGINLAAGAGAQNRSSLEAPPLSGGEPQGIRLSAAGTLAERANLSVGTGGLAAGPVSVEAGRAAPNQAMGGGVALASAQAGGAAATPLATAGKQVGGAASAGSDRGAASAAQETPGKLAGTGGGAKTGANPDTPNAQAKGKRPGGAASEGTATAGGDGSGSGKTLAASFGHAGQATPGSLRIGVKSAGSGPGTSQSGKTLALAPGEPGSSPTLAVTLQPLVAKPGGARRSADGGPALSSGGSGGSGAYPGATQVRSGGGEGGAAGARSGAATGSQDQAPVSLKTVQVADARIIRPDSQLKPLDVLAPSTYCPLPLPGHSFPDNRPPKAERGDDSLPAYAPDNPGFIFPIQAWAGNIQGKAIVRVEVLPDGRPGRMWLKQSSGSGLLDRDAQSQLTYWRFIPARKNGQPVAAWIDVPVVYRLQDAKK